MKTESYCVATPVSKIETDRVVDRFSVRTTANGKKILNDSLCVVDKISGNTVASKNLFGFYPNDAGGNSFRGVKITHDKNGTFTLSGTCTANSYISLVTLGNPDGSIVCPDYLKNKKILLYSFGSWTGSSYASLDFVYKNGSSYAISTARTDGYFVSEDVERLRFRFYIYSGTTYDTTLQLMIVEGETRDASIEYQPYFSGLKNAQISGVDSRTYNVLPFPYVDATSKTHYGITYTVNDDGSVLVNGTCTAAAGGFSIFTLTNSKLDYLNDDELLSMSGAPQGSTNDTYFYYNVTTGHKGSYNSPMIKLQNRYGKYDIRVASGVTVNNALFKPILIRASVFSETPPYVSQTIKSEMTLPQTVELGKWDYIKNAQLVRQTTIEDYDASKYDSETNTYNNSSEFILSANNSKIAYKSSPIITDILFDNSYVAYNNGLEIQKPLTDDIDLTCEIDVVYVVSIQRMSCATKVDFDSYERECGSIDLDDKTYTSCKMLGVDNDRS